MRRCCASQSRCVTEGLEVTQDRKGARCASAHERKLSKLAVHPAEVSEPWTTDRDSRTASGRSGTRID
eukprot:6889698-Prymnesium_polylepis.2